MRPVKSPPAPTTIAHGILVGWSAARLERRGRVWLSGRELAVDSDRWAAPARAERGYTSLLPDLAAWLSPTDGPYALIAESGGRREDRQKRILEGWRDAVIYEMYAGVRYDCSSESVAAWITRLARKVGMPLSFSAKLQPGAEEIALLPAPVAAEPAITEPPHDEAGHGSPGPAPPEHVTPASLPAQPPEDASRSPLPPEPEPYVESPEHREQRLRAYNELFGPKEEPRRRWLRRH